MPKRKYTNLKILLPEIKAMIAEGKSHSEIEEYFGLTGERPIHHISYIGVFLCCPHKLGLFRFLTGILFVKEHYGYPQTGMAIVFL